MVKPLWVVLKCKVAQGKFSIGLDLIKLQGTGTLP